MGQYDYQGTPQSRMYDWLVTRKGDTLELCTDGKISNHHEIEQEDLEYIRSLVAEDVDTPTEEQEGSEEVEVFVDEFGYVVKEAEARSGGRDYYTKPDGSSKIPEPLGATGELGVIQVIK